MVPVKSPARACHLRESYIAISTFVRSQLHRQRPSHAQLARPLPWSRQYASGSTTPAKPFREGDKSPTCGSPSSAPTTRRIHDLSAAQRQCLTRFEQSSLPTSTSTTPWKSLLQTAASVDTQEEWGQGPVHVVGYVTSYRPGRQCDFVELVDPRLELAIQVIVPTKEPAGASEQNARRPQDESLSRLKTVNAHTPVQITGSIVTRSKSPKKAAAVNPAASQSQQCSQPEKVTMDKTVRRLNRYVGWTKLISHVEIRAESVTTFNTFPAEVDAQTDTEFPPEARHLQFRTDHDLRRRIRLRADIAGQVRDYLRRAAQFDEVETPLLFKSTPEGAREFLVPTRRKGMAYALPQSPQQYKQVLMASGISRYFQFAKCFRDEDLRADRQPEFTQLDLEMSFAGSQDVMALVEAVLLTAVWPNARDIQPLRGAELASSDIISPASSRVGNLTFPRLTYANAMARYGSDKPDTRIGTEIHRVDDWLPRSAQAMLTSLENPRVEMIRMDMQDQDPRESRRFIKTVFDNATAYPYVHNPHGMPGVAVYDPRQPLRGLASFGHDGAMEVEERFSPAPGDIFIVQSRPDGPPVGGSTALGILRRDIHRAAVAEGLIAEPSGFAALWVVDFPLFSPLEPDEPGQGNTAGICSTHHPFTAPKAGQDLAALLTDPLSIIGDHYDLVINGVEVGGGSRRIHTADMQELILRDVLHMPPPRVEDFRHLLKALACGCPPHAGFALGFDRLMAMLTNRETVRDVIAFPKYADGQDKLTGSPSLVTAEQLATYSLAVTDGGQIPRGP